MLRRFAMLALSLSLLLGLSAAGSLLAQDARKDEPKKEEPKKDEGKKDEGKKDEGPKDEPKKAEEPLPSIPPEVEAKLEAARKAVAEAIVAAQDAGLVQTTIDPPPILDILVTGRATDRRELKKVADSKDKALQVGVSPEVFGAWYTGHGKYEGVDPAQKNVRIMMPSKGLKDLYDRRAEVLKRHLDEARAARPAAPAAETRKDEPRPAEDAKKAEEPKKDEPKAEAPKEEKKDEPKADEKKDEPKAEEKKDEPK